MDDIVRWEVLVAKNNSDFFPFDETLETVLLAFHRDHTMLEKGPYSHPMASLPRISAQVPRGLVPYPPNGVLPHSGIAILLAPLCYIYGDMLDLFCVWRSMFARSTAVYQGRRAAPCPTKEVHIKLHQTR